MKLSLLLIFLMAPFVQAFSSDAFLNAAGARHGADGARAAGFLVEHMPQADRDALDPAFLLENLDCALRARTNFPWAAAVPEALFFNDVLPYAVFDETREPWRADFYAKIVPLVAGAESATDAAQWLNRDFFNLVNVHYSTERAAPNQSPSESIASGKASCSGLSILLVDALRAAGIPARAAGTPNWTRKNGNHTWVEFWDDGWHFLGADEYDAAGPDRGWFVDDAAAALKDDPAHAIYATSWTSTGLHFPMVWDLDTQSVAAVNVTARYAAPQQNVPDELGVRLISPNGKRVARRGILTTEDGVAIRCFETYDETADLNDLPHLAVSPGQRVRIRFGVWQTEPFEIAAGWNEKEVRPDDLSLVPALSKREVTKETRRIFEQLVDASRDARQAELDAQAIVLGDKTMRWKEESFGREPKGGHSLWISMHGGGNAPASLNDQQWNNQAGLYQPDEGIYVAPRAPTDTWNLWHEAHIDPMFQRLIEDFVALRGVNPGRIYLMGYSAGGDGVWQLAPRMADRFAAAAMMAGHPNEASVLGLRNLPFALFVGAEDSGYDRNKVAAEKAAELKRLHDDDPDGYTHFVRIYPGLPHWMSGKDKEALPWMAEFARNPWPRRIVWLQDDVVHSRFYWLRIPDGSAQKGQKIIATVDGQEISLEGDVPAGMRIRLSDELLNLDKPVSVLVNAEERFFGHVPREACVIRQTLTERVDPDAAACAEILLP